MDTQDKQSKDIVDVNGNAYKRTKDNRILQFIKDDIKDIGGSGLALTTAIVGVLNWVISKFSSVSCANFYGINKKYFSGTEIFEDKLIFIFLMVILFAYPFVFVYINKKINSKIYVAATFLLTACILFSQNLLFTIDIIDIIPFESIKRVVDSYVTIGVLLIDDIVISYFIIIRDSGGKKKKYNNLETVIFAIALILYFANIITGISMRMTYEIDDKKTYETIDQDKVVVSEYEGKFVVMECEVQGETLILKKGTCRLEEMVGVPILYHKYEKVICEYQ